MCNIVQHVLYLIVNNGLKYVHNSVAKVRNTVRFVRCSLARLEKFKTFIHVVGRECKKMLCPNVPTIWNSTFFMLEMTKQYRKVFDVMRDEDMQYVNHFDVE